MLILRPENSFWKVRIDTWYSSKPSRPALRCLIWVEDSGADLFDALFDGEDRSGIDFFTSNNWGVEKSITIKTFIVMTIGAILVKHLCKWYLGSKSSLWWSWSSSWSSWWGWGKWDLVYRSTSPKLVEPHSALLSEQLASSSPSMMHHCQRHQHHHSHHHHNHHHDHHHYHFQ